MTKEKKPTGLDLMREPFPPNQISKLPKPTKKQTEEVRADYTKGIRCVECGQWHHPKVVHLDYVGHAALTDRLLDCDPAWTWEPLSIGDNGLPVLDGFGGLWIKLTVCGQTRLGYGDADGKQGGNAIKEAIGDALRNAAMRFGAALDLWHKGDLHVDDEPENNPVSRKTTTPTPDEEKPKATDAEMETAMDKIASCESMEELGAFWKGLNANAKHVAADPDVIEAKEKRKAQLKGTQDA